MQLLKTLIDQKPGHGKQALTAPLHELYDGDLQFPVCRGPYTIANFVGTLDGVISFKKPGFAGGSAISGSNTADRFTMGLLRATADAIVVGAHTVHDVDPHSLWTAEYAHPPSKALYDEYRTNTLGKGRFPLMGIVSGSGNLDLTRAIFRSPEVQVVIISTAVGRDVLTKAGATRLRGVEVIAVETDGLIDAKTIVHLLFSQFGVQLLLHEGGSVLFGQFLQGGLIQELFLTVSPQIAGRATDVTRPGLVEGLAFAPGGAPWFQLIAIKQSGDHLFLRYRYSGPREMKP